MRNKCKRNFKLISDRNPVSGLVIGKGGAIGRDNRGRISIWHRGGSKVHKLYRIVDFSFLYEGVPCIVRRLEYDPNRNAFIALVCYVTGVLSYVLAYKGIHCGDVLFFLRNAAVSSMGLGSGTLLRQFQERMQVYNFGSISRKGQFARAGGVTAMVLKRFSRHYSVLKFPSKEEKYVLGKLSFAFKGSPLCASLWLRRDSIRKAGRLRNLGWRPVVRGVAMNPVDHPHGGGEGRRKGRLSVSPWGWLTKSKRSRVRSSFIIKRRDWFRS